MNRTDQLVKSSLFRTLIIFAALLIGTVSLAETRAFKRIIQGNNMMHYASLADGTQFWLDWELIDKGGERVKYTRAIASTGRDLGDMNIDCVANRVSVATNGWLTPPEGSAFWIILKKICGKDIGGYKFVFAGPIADMDLFVSVGNVRFNLGAGGTFDVKLNTSQPVGAYLSDAWWEAPNYETLRIDCETYQGFISKKHPLSASPDFSQSTKTQFDKGAAVFKRICDPQRKFLGYIRPSLDSDGYGSGGIGQGSVDKNVTIRACIARGATPGTPEFTACLNDTK